MGCCDDETKSAIETSNLDGLICYCFKYSKKELHTAVLAGKEEVIINAIKMKMKDPGCFCETANPSGKCCLADLTAFVKAVRQ